MLRAVRTCARACARVGVSVLIALDYGDTFTADVELWTSFCRYAARRGHTVICATMRHEAEGLEVVQAMRGLVSQIVFTARQAKRPALAARGLGPDVWIDDEPRWILEGAS